MYLCTGVHLNSISSNWFRMWHRHRLQTWVVPPMLGRHPAVGCSAAGQAILSSGTDTIDRLSMTSYTGSNAQVYNGFQSPTTST